jgi:ketosteroid isomerase-like protein
MRVAILVLVTLLCPAGLMAQNADGKLRSDLQAIHDKWFKAFDGGDGAAMDQMEADNLTLVLPNGMVWPKDKPRAGVQSKRDPQTQHALSDVAVRRFGDTAVLTGIVTTTTPKETSKDATTVVFVQRSGKWLIASVQWTPVEEAK